MCRKGYNNDILGNVLQKMGLLDESLDFVDKVIELNPKYEDVFDIKGYNTIILGTIMYNLGKIDDALECFEKEIELNPKNATAYNHKG